MLYICTHFTITWWCLMSTLTCACIKVMHISALHWKLGTYVVLPVHIGHKVCIMRFSSDWWAGMCSITWSSSDDTSWTHVSIISPIRSKCHPVVLALMICTTERCADFQSTVVTRLVCWGRWSSVWLAGSCIMFPHQCASGTRLMMHITDSRRLLSDEMLSRLNRIPWHSQ